MGEEGRERTSRRGEGEEGHGRVGGRRELRAVKGGEN